MSAAALRSADSKTPVYILPFFFLDVFLGRYSAF